ncbi:hypothetical protein FZ983_27425 [Azospirillum sp. B21]|uniref:hypothetical protein n=1 Tax=Azospirillum sp. B21 TaxID=2607496 RepID=UPI0011EE7AE5|nr:hypothetical protein [Azospirillum sp. B21]KAA0574633.1 hypothetical protein FZ983_27425 [Azospirillum sp. B21]
MSSPSAAVGGDGVPLDWGDRVEHRLFGLGHIVDIENDKLEIAFDESGTKRVMSSFVTKVASAETKGIAYWNRQFKPLVAAWLTAREEVTRLLPQMFRPLHPLQPDDLQRQLSAADEKERMARAAIDAFLEEDRQGHHP